MPTLEGCPHCNPKLAAVLRMNSTEYSAWLTNQTQEHIATLRAAERGGRTVTMTITQQRGAWTPAKAADQTARIRAAAGVPEQVKVPFIARSDGGVPTPDLAGYIVALERQRLGDAALPAPTPTTRTAATSAWTPAEPIDLVARIQAQEAAKASANRGRR